MIFLQTESHFGHFADKGGGGNFTSFMDDLLRITVKLMSGLLLLGDITRILDLVGFIVNLSLIHQMLRLVTSLFNPFSTGGGKSR